MGDKKPPPKSKPMKPLRPLRACKVPPKPPAGPKNEKKKEQISSSSSTTSTSSNSSLSSSKFEDKKESKGPKSDLSVLRKSVDTSVSDLAQVVKIFQTGTPEITSILTKECSVIYECKVCRNLFRSIANFLSHKRTYCTSKAADRENEEDGKVTEKTVLLNGTKGNTISSRTTTRQDIISILDTITRKTPLSEVKENNTVTLSEINGTTEALYLNKNPVINADSESDSERSVILGPDGKILRSSTSTPDSQSTGTSCNICSKTMDSYSQVMDHIRADHTEYKNFFICPVCKKYFVNLWSVSRHLVKAHRRPTDKVRKMRGALQKKKVTLEALAKMVGPATKPLVDKPCQYNQEKAWLEGLEGNTEFQRCMGCGKKFDRKVALISHSQSCQKRPPSVTREKPPPPKLSDPPSQDTQPSSVEPLPSSPEPPPSNSDSAPTSPAKPPSLLVLPAEFKPPQEKCHIQVRMFYGKEGTPKKSMSDDGEKSFVTRDLSIGYTNSEASSPSPMPQLSPVVSEKSETDRYKRDFEMQDKCVRLEAKLLQLHKAAVEVQKLDLRALPDQIYNQPETTSRDLVVLASEEKTHPITFINPKDITNEENLVTSTVGSSDPLALDDEVDDRGSLDIFVSENMNGGLSPKNFKSYLSKSKVRSGSIGNFVGRLRPKENIKGTKNGKRKGKRKREKQSIGDSNSKKICLGKEYFESKLSSSLDMMSTEAPNSSDPDTVRAVMMEVLFGSGVTSEILYNHVRDESSDDD